MAFWCRIRETKLVRLSNQFKRCYFGIPGPCLADQTASHPIIRVIGTPTSVIHKTGIDFANNVRFFAAPVQAKPKQEEKDTSGPRLNEQITAEFIRLVTEEGHGVVSRREALERARRLNLDLIEVQRNAKPPVCKIADYHKEKYKQQIKEKDRAKSKSEVTLRKGDCKEVRFSGKTEQKDLQIKADTVKRLMDRGYRVKCMALGTEDQDLGGLLSRLSALIEDVSIVESGPRVEKKQAYAIVRHVKFGPSKKGSGKKASKVVGATGPEVPNIATSTPSVNPDPESGFETDDEILFEEADTPTSPSLEMTDNGLDQKNPSWSAFDANDDFESVFDIRDDAKASKCSGRVGTNPAPQTRPSAATNFSDLLRPGSVVDSVRKETVLPSPREPRNEYPPAKSMDGKGTGFGIFSAPKVDDASGKNGLPVENRYKKGNAFDPTRNPRTRGVPADPNAPPSNTDRGGRPGVDNGGQGKWGIFSTEGSNVIPSRNSESQAKAQR